MSRRAGPALAGLKTVGRACALGWLAFPFAASCHFALALRTPAQARSSSFSLSRRLTRPLFFAHWTHTLVHGHLFQRLAAAIAQPPALAAVLISRHTGLAESMVCNPASF